MGVANFISDNLRFLDKQCRVNELKVKKNITLHYVGRARVCEMNKNTLRGIHRFSYKRAYIIIMIYKQW